MFNSYSIKRGLSDCLVDATRSIPILCLHLSPDDLLILCKILQHKTYHHYQKNINNVSCIYSFLTYLLIERLSDIRKQCDVGEVFFPMKNNSAIKRLVLICLFSSHFHPAVLTLLITILLINSNKNIIKLV